MYLLPPPQNHKRNPTTGNSVHTCRTQHHGPHSANDIDTNVWERDTRGDAVAYELFYVASKMYFHAQATPIISRNRRKAELRESILLACLISRIHRYTPSPFKGRSHAFDFHLPPLDRLQQLIYSATLRVYRATSEAESHLPFSIPESLGSYRRSPGDRQRHTDLAVDCPASATQVHSLQDSGDSST
ncbi:hypothetical protein CSKR_113071 [Clonorchis sinensis]|uniref:Uncharacterized protein n=1 Tax=Clonorchis sinensis TaxID=79923 RepID=A0A3R7GUF7_CLOSI|nr:hypothetical protein CSKR_113071 [Clonorchis sinensis]